MKWMIVPLLAFACVGIAAGDIIIGPFDTTASFSPQEIALAPGSGDFWVNVNLDWSWTEGIPFSPNGYGVLLHLSIVDEYGNAAAQFSIPDQRSTVGDVVIRQYNGYINAYSTVPAEFPYMPLHINMTDYPKVHILSGLRKWAVRNRSALCSMMLLSPSPQPNRCASQWSPSRARWR